MYVRVYEQYVTVAQQRTKRRFTESRARCSGLQGNAMASQSCATAHGTRRRLGRRDLLPPRVPRSYD